MIQTKTKTARATTRCLLDITDVPPSAFALPDDGRKFKSLQAGRKAVASKLARHAHADGSETYPSVKTIMTATGFSRATIFRLLTDLRTLGVLRDGDIHGFHKTRVRQLDVQRLIRPVSDSTKDLSQIQKDPSQVRQAPVSGSTGTRLRFDGHPSQIDHDPSQIAPDSYCPIKVLSEETTECPTEPSQPTDSTVGSQESQESGRPDSSLKTGLIVKREGSGVPPAETCICCKKLHRKMVGGIVIRRGPNGYCQSHSSPDYETEA